MVPLPRVHTSNTVYYGLPPYAAHGYFIASARGLYNRLVTVRRQKPLTQRTIDSLPPLRVGLLLTRSRPPVFLRFISLRFAQEAVVSDKRRRLKAL